MKLKLQYYHVMTICALHAIGLAQSNSKMVILDEVIAGARAHSGILTNAKGNATITELLPTRNRSKNNIVEWAWEPNHWVVQKTKSVSTVGNKSTSQINSIEYLDNISLNFTPSLKHATITSRDVDLGPLRFFFSGIDGIGSDHKIVSLLETLKNGELDYDVERETDSSDSLVIIRWKTEKGAEAKLHVDTSKQYSFVKYEYKRGADFLTEAYANMELDAKADVWFPVSYGHTTTIKGKVEDQFKVVLQNTQLNIPNLPDISIKLPPKTGVQDALNQSTYHTQTETTLKQLLGKEQPRKGAMFGVNKYLLGFGAVLLTGWIYYFLSRRKRSA